MTDAGAVFIAVAVIAASGAAFGFLLYRAGSLPHPAPIVISLSMLTLVALIIAASSDSAAALTIAGTGMGALAGALAGIFKPPSDGP